MSQEPRWTPVASFAAVYEAEQAVSILEDAGIAATVSDDPDDARPTAPAVAVLVPESRAVEARELLAEDPPEA